MYLGLLIQLCLGLGCCALYCSRRGIPVMQPGRPQVVTIKNKYIILNDTGLPIEYKQKGTPDPDQPYGQGRRFAGQLLHNRWGLMTAWYS